MHEGMRRSCGGIYRFVFACCRIWLTLNRMSSADIYVDSGGGGVVMVPCWLQSYVEVVFRNDMVRAVIDVVRETTLNAVPATMDYVESLMSLSTT